MTKKIDVFSVKELQLILDCKKLKNLRDHFGPQEINCLLEITRLRLKKYYSDTMPNQKFDQGLLATGEILSNPIYLLYCVCGVFSAITFSLMCLITIPIACSLGFLYFRTSYEQEEKAHTKQQSELLLTLIKLEALSKGIGRIQQSDDAFSLVTLRPDPSHDRKKLLRLRDAVSTGIGVISATFSSYYCLAIVIGGCSAPLAISMLSPLMVIAAITCSTIAGGYFGYKYFQAALHKDVLKKDRKHLQNLLEEKTKEFNELLKSQKKQTRKAHRKPSGYKVPMPVLVSRLSEHYEASGAPLKTSQFNIIFFPKAIRRSRVKIQLHTRLILN